jgi:hypothetical protein
MISERALGGDAGQQPLARGMTEFLSFPAVRQRFSYTMKAMNGAISAWQLWAAVAMPTFVTLLGILLNRRDIERLDRGIDSLEMRLGKRIDGLDRRVEMVEGRMNQQTQVFHQDVLSLLKMHQGLDIR